MTDFKNGQLVKAIRNKEDYYKVGDIIQIDDTFPTSTIPYVIVKRTGERVIADKCDLDEIDETTDVAQTKLEEEKSQEVLKTKTIKNYFVTITEYRKTKKVFYGEVMAETKEEAEIMVSKTRKESQSNMKPYHNNMCEGGSGDLISIEESFEVIEVK